MNSITFFLCFIPLLALILLALNLLFAPHSPYQEKSSTFECGFHSFLGQNRTQFSISFFIFGLLFLLFDLELLVVYPLTTSFYTNGGYGLAIMLIFFLVLTLGFAFELGKKALSIDSRQYNQTSNLKSEVISIKFIFHIVRESSIQYYKQFNLLRFFAICIIGQVVRYFFPFNILNYTTLEVILIAGLIVFISYIYFTPLSKLISKLTHKVLNIFAIVCFTAVMGVIIYYFINIDLSDNAIIVSIFTGLFANMENNFILMDGNRGGGSYGPYGPYKPSGPGGPPGPPGLVCGGGHRGDRPEGNGGYVGTVDNETNDYDQEILTERKKREWTTNWAGRAGLNVENAIFGANLSKQQSAGLHKGLTFIFREEITAREISNAPNLFKSLERGKEAFVINKDNTDAHVEIRNNLIDAVRIIDNHIVPYSAGLKNKLPVADFFVPKNYTKNYSSSIVPISKLLQ